MICKGVNRFFCIEFQLYMVDTHLLIIKPAVLFKQRLHNLILKDMLTGFMSYGDTVRQQCMVINCYNDKFSITVSPQSLEKREFYERTA